MIKSILTIYLKIGRIMRGVMRAFKRIKKTEIVRKIFRAPYRIAYFFKSFLSGEVSIEKPMATRVRPRLLISNARTTFLIEERSMRWSVSGFISDSSKAPNVEEKGFSGMIPIIGLHASEATIKRTDPMMTRIMGKDP